LRLLIGIAAAARRRPILAALAGAVVAVLVWVAVIGVLAAIRGPRLVAQLDRAGALSFMPASLTPRRTCALLAVQDRTFYRHHGIGLLDGHLGHTTITQGICKRLFFDRFSRGFLRHRKLRLMVIAFGFDWRIPKDTQLRLFLNRVYLGSVDGGEILGFPAAAHAYFGKDLESLSEREYLALVAMPVAPKNYHVLREAEASAARVRSLQELVDGACAPQCLQNTPIVPCQARTRRSMLDGPGPS
jgi:penicillin-binding protein 1A